MPLATFALLVQQLQEIVNTQSHVLFHFPVQSNTKSDYSLLQMSAPPAMDIGCMQEVQLGPG